MPSREADVKEADQHRSRNAGRDSDQHVVLIDHQQFPALKKCRGFRGRLQEAFVTRDTGLVFTYEGNLGIITSS